MTHYAKQLDEKLELKAVELVGSAAACSQMREWRLLEKKILEALKWAYELNH